MKIIENAYKLIGKEIPKGYQESFIETFYEALDNKENFKMCFKSPNPMGEIKYKTKTKKFENLREASKDEIER